MSDNASPVATAIAAAFDLEYAEFEHGGPADIPDQAVYAWMTSTSIAKTALADVLFEPLATEMANVLARAARAIAWELPE